MREMSVTTVPTSRVGGPVSLVGAPLRETHASFTLVIQVVRVIRAATGVEGTPSRTTAMPLCEERERLWRAAVRASDSSPVLAPTATSQDGTSKTIAIALEPHQLRHVIPQSLRRPSANAEEALVTPCAGDAKLLDVPPPTVKLQALVRDLARHVAHEDLGERNQLYRVHRDVALVYVLVLVVRVGPAVGESTRR